ncbi:TonB-dependent receptor [Opitutales bacterium ASA1]|uniref:TonB-dependent receptor n=1 Tax=Congregicoccus parvus TaxID=3081749 RepID=UPI002B2F814C|nr:TonB-dependent receptor [Opitutales bacterium ASA1]
MTSLAALAARTLLPAVALGLVHTTVPGLEAQVVSGGMTGLVTSSSGAPVAGASVKATHVPTGTVYQATTRANGRFDFRSMVVGGPYELVVESSEFKSGKRSNLATTLGADVEVNVVLEGLGEVVELEELEVSATFNDLDATQIGSGITFNAADLEAKPTSERSFADLISANPLVTLRSTFGDREESQITALGQNNRFNSIMIDGSRINDQFGLNGTGLASFFNPISVEWIEQMSVQLSPFDARWAGFTGAAVNTVTKGGTNKFKGGAYYYFSGDEVFGLQLRGENGTDRENTDTKVVPRLERPTWGVFVGGPIIQNKLFFFAGYEKFESIGTGRDLRFSTPAEAAILAQLNAISSASGTSVDWGSAVTGTTSNVAEDEKIIGKLDWNISENHRASVRYLSAEGSVPQFGNHASTTSSLNGVSGGITTAADGHFYSQERKEESVAAQLFSQWTPDFKTEIKYATTTQDQLTPLNSVAPMVAIFGVSGTNLVTGRPVPDDSVPAGTYFAGTERFRHGNVIAVESDQLSATADYFWRNWVFSGGIEREQSDFYNLFREGSYGLVAYRTYADFLADQNAIITRNVYDPSVRPVADISDFTTTGIFANAKWDVSRKLTLSFGLRYEFADSGPGPALNQALLTTTGFRNDGTVDGFSAVSPRVGFNLAIDDDRTMQVRGGFGHFVGRAPWVFFSNSYGQTGVGGFTLDSRQGELPSSLTAYLRDEFNPADPIGTGVDRPSLRRQIDWSDDGVELPQVWRANLAVDKKLKFLGSVLSAEIVRTEVDKALFITNENLRPTSVGADGRQRFAGNPSTQANALFPAFTNLYRISNVEGGASTYVTASWSRPTQNKWGFSLSYTRGDATEAQAMGQTTAGGQWGRNVVFNQNTEEVGTADFEIKDRVQFSLNRQFEFVKNWRTLVSLYYEGRTGNPYSWVYSNDINGDGWTQNDTIAVPDGASDARFDFSAMTAGQLDAYLAFMESSGLSKYAGGVAPKNAFYEPWVNRLDLKFEQTIPMRGDVRMKLFFDFINFGAFISRSLFDYTEISPLLSNDVFRRRQIGNATYENGLIRPAAFTSEPAGFNIDNGMSRWRIQLGAKLEF